MAKTIIKTDVEFGKEYEDIVTGFKGVAVAVSKFQFGCVRIGLQPKVLEMGKKPEAEWFDEESLKKMKPVKKSPGGPTPAPKSNPDPIGG